MILLIIGTAVCFIVFFAVMWAIVTQDQNRARRDTLPPIKPRFRLSFRETHIACDPINISAHQLMMRRSGLYFKVENIILSDVDKTRLTHGAETTQTKLNSV